MASHRQKKRKRCGDESGSTYTYRLPSLSCLVVAMMVVVVVALLDLSGSGVGVDAVPVITTVSMVVSKILLPGPCTDLSGTVVGDQAEWTDGCTKVVCHVEPSGNYTVTHKCRDLVPSENPDDTNCYTTVNQTAGYPGCCPSLLCGAAHSLLTTLDPSLCVDGSSFNTCQIWKELSANCTLTTSLAYNLTLTYCQATCGHCAGGVG